MRYGPNDTFWVVTDPGPEATLDDILFETTLAGFDRQLKGGLTMADEPTIFTDRDEAEADARWRLMARRLHEELKRRPELGRNGVDRFELKDAKGNVVHRGVIGPLPGEDAQ
jgi:hypothetical protein